MRTICCAAGLIFACLSVAVAEEFSASIIKVEGNRVTFQKTKKGKKEGEAQTLPAKDGVKVVTGKYNKETRKLEAGDEIADGLKAPGFAKIGPQGVNARILTTDDNKSITEIRVFQVPKKDAK